jgi:hypothetical protein
MRTAAARYRGPSPLSRDDPPEPWSLRLERVKSVAGTAHYRAVPATHSTTSYLRKVRTAGKLVRPEASLARRLTVYRPGPRNRWAGSQLRV